MKVVDFAAMDIGATEPDPVAMFNAGVRVVIMRRFVCWFNPAHRAWVMSPDPTYQRWAQPCRDAGLVVMAYDFYGLGHGAPSAEDQVATAESAGAVCEGIDLSTAIDVEFTGRGIVETGLSQREVAKQIDAIIAARHARTGCEVGVYTSHVQMHDDNGLGGAALENAELTWLWVKQPYQHAAGHAPDGVDDAIHFGPAKWDPHDYFRVPDAWSTRGYWITQTQGDAIGFPGVRQCDIGVFHVLDATKPHDPRWTWVQKKLGVLVTGEYNSATDAALRLFQTSKALDADAVIGPRTFAALLWS